MSIPIQPATITDVKTVASFGVRVTNLELFSSVSVLVTLQGADGAVVGTRSFVVAGPDYLAWNNDDQYLINWVAGKLGFILAA